MTLAAPGARGAAGVVVTGALFGSSFGAIRVAVEALGPFTVASGRMALGGLLLLVITLARGTWALGSPADRARVLVIAAFGFALPFALLAWAEQELASGMAALLLATSPVTGLLVSHAFTDDDRVTRAKLLAVVLGFTGVAIALSGGARLFTSWPSVLAVLSCGVGYAAGGLVSRRVTTLPSDVVTANALVVGALLCAPFSLVLERPVARPVDVTALLALAWLGTVATGLAWALRYRQVARYGYSFATYAGFVAPLFALVVGAAWLDETISPAAVVGLALVLGGRAVTLERITLLRR